MLIVQYWYNIDRHHRVSAHKKSATLGLWPGPEISSGMLLVEGIGVCIGIGIGIGIGYRHYIFYQKWIWPFKVTLMSRNSRWSLSKQWFVLKQEYAYLEPIGYIYATCLVNLLPEDKLTFQFHIRITRIEMAIIPFEFGLKAPQLLGLGKLFLPLTRWQLLPRTILYRNT